MNGTLTIGIDAAKRLFFLHGEDERGKVILREKLSRERLLPFLANQAISTIAIEAGCGLTIGRAPSRSSVTRSG